MKTNGRKSSTKARARSKDKDIDRLFADGRLIDRAMKRAVRAAILDHKRAGNPICTLKNGRVVWIPPEKI
jgi:hypothetical protein